MSYNNPSTKNFRKDARWLHIWNSLMWFCAGTGLATLSDEAKSAGGLGVGNVALFISTLLGVSAISYAIYHFLIARANDMVEDHVKAATSVAIDGMTNLAKDVLKAIADDEKDAQKPAEKASSKKDGADTVSKPKPASNAKKSTKKGK